VGLESTVFASVGERFIHYATSYLRYLFANMTFKIPQILAPIITNYYTNYYYKCHIIEQYIQFVYYLPVDSAVH